jgi:hypothetical protein
MVVRAQLHLHSGGVMEHGLAVHLAHPVQQDPPDLRDPPQLFPDPPDPLDLLDQPDHPDLVRLQISTLLVVIVMGQFRMSALLLHQEILMLPALDPTKLLRRQDSKVEILKDQPIIYLALGVGWGVMLVAYALNVLPVF